MLTITAAASLNQNKQTTQNQKAAYVQATAITSPRTEQVRVSAVALQNPGEQTVMTVASALSQKRGKDLLWPACQTTHPCVTRRM